MKLIILSILLSFNAIHFIYSQTNNNEFGSIEDILNFLDTCYTDKAKVSIIEQGEDSFSNSGLILYFKININMDDIRVQGNCNNTLNTFIDSSAYTKKYAGEKLREFYVDELKSVIRKCYYRHLNNMSYNFIKDIDSLNEIMRVADSVFKYNETADTLDGIYIPKDLDDTYDRMLLFFNNDALETYKNLEEERAVGVEHLGIGMVIRNLWKLWGHSRLYKYFENQGIKGPDYISDIILHSWHRFLNKKTINLDEQIKKAIEYEKEDK